MKRLRVAGAQIPVTKDIPCSAPSGVIDPNGNWRLKTRHKGEDTFVYAIELDA